MDSARQRSAVFTVLYGGAICRALWTCGGCYNYSRVGMSRQGDAVRRSLHGAAVSSVTQGGAVRSTLMSCEGHERVPSTMVRHGEEVSVKGGGKFRACSVGMGRARFSTAANSGRHLQLQLSVRVLVPAHAISSRADGTPCKKQVSVGLASA